jgi:hypothetical protein
MDERRIKKHRWLDGRMEGWKDGRTVPDEPECDIQRL